MRTFSRVGLVEPKCQAVNVACRVRAQFRGSTSDNSAERVVVQKSEALDWDCQSEASGGVALFSSSALPESACDGGPHYKSQSKSRFRFVQSILWFDA